MLKRKRFLALKEWAHSTKKLLPCIVDLHVARCSDTTSVSSGPARGHDRTGRGSTHTAAALVPSTLLPAVQRERDVLISRNHGFGSSQCQ